MLPFVVALSLLHGSGDEVTTHFREACTINRGGKGERCFIAATRALRGEKCSLFVLDVEPLPTIDDLCIGTGGSDINRGAFSAIVVRGAECKCASVTVVSRRAQGSFENLGSIEKPTVTTSNEKRHTPIDDKETPHAWTDSWENLDVKASASFGVLALKAHLVGFRATGSLDDAICLDAKSKYPAEITNKYEPIFKCQ